jgi:hypothetical protein
MLSFTRGVSCFSVHIQKTGEDYYLCQNGLKVIILCDDGANTYMYLVKTAYTKDSILLFSGMK